MSRPESASASFDPEAVNAKYIAERDKRLVEGRADIRDLDHDDVFGHYRDDPFTPFVERPPVSDEVDVVILGGGIAGVLVGAELRKRGVERIRIVDQAGGIGGTWYWNRYPGVMCDVESYIYIPMLEEFGYIPTCRYASGDEIRGHLERIAERYRLTDDALFHTDVTRAEWHDEEARWHVLHRPRRQRRLPLVRAGRRDPQPHEVAVTSPGMEDFAGHSFHTARWDYDYTGGGTDEPLDKLEGKAIALLGTGASGIQALPPLVESAKHVYVFQRTPSAIGVRDNRPTDDAFGRDLEPGWQKQRMDNFQAVMLGRKVDRDAVDDGWTHHYAAVNNPRYVKGMTREEFLQSAEELDYGIMEAAPAAGRGASLPITPMAEVLKPYYRYICKRPCFHDEYLTAFNSPNVTLIDCPAGIEKITAKGPWSTGGSTRSTASSTGPASKPSARPSPGASATRSSAATGSRWPSGGPTGLLTLFGIMSRGFPNMFAMPAPTQQSRRDRQLHAAGGAGGRVRRHHHQPAPGGGGRGVRRERRGRGRPGCRRSSGQYTDISRVMSACTPSRINNEGHPETLSPKAGNYGGGFGDWFAYRELLERWLEDGCFEGLELDLLSPSAMPTTP